MALKRLYPFLPLCTLWTLVAVPLSNSLPDVAQSSSRPAIVYDKADPAFRYLPDPDELAKIVTHGTEDEIKLFKNLYTSALQQFDLQGYNWLMSGVPGMDNMAMMSLMMVKGLIQAVASTVMDIVPPLIPPPVWINRHLPCLPMLTGMNCLGSVLYPITMAEFVEADVSDSVMNGVISSFPSKYRSKVGKTSEAQYRIWNFGVDVDASLLPAMLGDACSLPGLLLPPFCSFSVFINHRRVPPQLVSYDESHPYPKDCPKFNPLYDTPDDVFDVSEPLPSPIKRGVPPLLPVYPPLGRQLKDYAQVQPPKRVEPPPCNCSDMQKLLQRHCQLHEGIPVEVEANKTHAATHYQIPATIPVRCCIECQEVVKQMQRELSVSQEPTRELPAPPPPPRKDEGPTPKLGHVIPLDHRHKQKHFTKG